MRLCGGKLLFYRFLESEWMGGGMIISFGKFNGSSSSTLLAVSGG